MTWYEPEKGRAVRWTSGLDVLLSALAVCLVVGVSLVVSPQGASASGIVGLATSAPAFTPSSESRPEVTGLSPSQATVGDLAFTITVIGSGFFQGSTVLWNGASRDTGFISPTMLTATVRADDLLSAGTAYVSVSNPGPSGGESLGSQAFTVLNAIPEISALDPDRAWAGSPSFPMTVSGTGLAPTSVVQIAGIDQDTHFVDDHTLRVDVPEEAARYAQGLSVRVFTPPPGGGLSPAVFLWFLDDNVPPVTRASGPKNLWNRRAVTVTLVANDVGRGVEKTFYRIDERGQYSTGTKVRIPAPADHSNDGMHVVHFFSIDAVLNWEEPPREVSVGIDTTPPTTAVTAATVRRGQSLSPEYRVYDRVSPKARDALLQIIDREGTVVLRSALGEPSMRGWHVGDAFEVDLPRGKYTMRVLAHDLAGNAQSSTKSAVLTVK